MSSFKDFLVKNKVVLIVLDVLFLVLFFFVGVPKMPFFKGLLAFLIVEAFFVLAVFLYKVLYLDKR
jgi:hypothetical protein